MYEGWGGQAPPRKKSKNPGTKKRVKKFFSPAAGMFQGIFYAFFWHSKPKMCTENKVLKKNGPFFQNFRRLRRQK